MALSDAQMNRLEELGAKPSLTDAEMTEMESLEGGAQADDQSEEELAPKPVKQVGMLEAFAPGFVESEKARVADARKQMGNIDFTKSRDEAQLQGNKDFAAPMDAAMSGAIPQFRRAFSPGVGEDIKNAAHEHPVAMGAGTLVSPAGKALGMVGKLIPGAGAAAEAGRLALSGAAGGAAYSDDAESVLPNMAIGAAGALGLGGAAIGAAKGLKFLSDKWGPAAAKWALEAAERYMNDHPGGDTGTVRSMQEPDADGVKRITRLAMLYLNEIMPEGMSNLIRGAKAEVPNATAMEGASSQRLGAFRDEQLAPHSITNQQAQDQLAVLRSNDIASNPGTNVLDDNGYRLVQDSLNKANQPPLGKTLQSVAPNEFGSVPDETWGPMQRNADAMSKFGDDARQFQIASDDASRANTDLARAQYQAIADSEAQNPRIVGSDSGRPPAVTKAVKTMEPDGTEGMNLRVSRRDPSVTIARPDAEMPLASQQSVQPQMPVPPDLEPVVQPSQGGDLNLAETHAQIGSEELAPLDRFSSEQPQIDMATLARERSRYQQLSADPQKSISSYASPEDFKYASDKLGEIIDQNIPRDTSERYAQEMARHSDRATATDIIAAKSIGGKDNPSIGSRSMMETAVRNVAGGYNRASAKANKFVFNQARKKLMSEIARRDRISPLNPADFSSAADLGPDITPETAAQFERLIENLNALPKDSDFGFYMNFMTQQNPAFAGYIANMLNGDK